MVTGTEIRRFRRLLGQNQIDFAKRLGISQPALSGIESGRIAVSDYHVELLKKEFSAPSFNPPFVEFLRGLISDGKIRDPLALAVAGRYLTLTVCRWHEGIDLARVSSADQIVGLVTIPATDRATLAFEMISTTTDWKNRDILVFAECKPFEAHKGEPCLVQFRKGKRLRALLGIWHGDGAMARILLPRGRTQVVPNDSVIATFREELRVTRPSRE